MPVSEPEIKADRDRLRAEYAIKVHKLETQLDQAKLERARQLIEINRRDASISTLETDMMQLKADLEENQNARRVLEQTVADRLPKVEATARGGQAPAVQPRPRDRRADGRAPSSTSWRSRRQAPSTPSRTRRSSG